MATVWWNNSHSPACPKVRHDNTSQPCMIREQRNWVTLYCTHVARTGIVTIQPKRITINWQRSPKRWFVTLNDQQMGLIYVYQMIYNNNMLTWFLIGRSLYCRWNSSQIQQWLWTFLFSFGTSILYNGNFIEKCERIGDGVKIRHICDAANATNGSTLPAAYVIILMRCSNIWCDRSSNVWFVSILYYSLLIQSIAIAMHFKMFLTGIWLLFTMKSPLLAK